MSFSEERKSGVKGLINRRQFLQSGTCLAAVGTSTMLFPRVTATRKTLQCRRVFHPMGALILTLFPGWTRTGATTSRRDREWNLPISITSRARSRDATISPGWEPTTRVIGLPSGLRARISPLSMGNISPPGRRSQAPFVIYD